MSSSDDSDSFSGGSNGVGARVGPGMRTRCHVRVFEYAGITSPWQQSYLHSSATPPHRHVDQSCIKHGVAIAMGIHG